MSYFGTDGIRGQFGVFPITPDFLLRLGFGAGQVLMRQSLNKRPSVLIGKDTRLSGYVIEAALQAGFNAAGVDVHMLGPLPTPAIAHLVKSFHADMGVVISASHNPYQDNGVKFFNHEGKKISDEMQNAINDQLTALVDDTNASLARLEGIKADAIGKNHRIADANGRYIEYCKGSFPYHLNLSNLKIVIDCANGAGYSVAPRVLQELGAQVIAIHNTPNGININDNCGSTHPNIIQAAVREYGADVGIALDGDGDRIIMADNQGNIIDGDGILYILAKHLKPVGVVGTLMSNVALELALANQGIGFYRAQVGDRYVMQALQERGWSIGGEPSGHILCLDKSRTGDAIVAGLQVLSCIAETGKSLRELVLDYTPFPQTLINVRLTQMSNPYDNDELNTIFKNAEEQLSDQGRLLIRQSGTEPVIRVMVEHQNQAVCQEVAQKLAAEVRRVLA
ncbi:phosphoglucosamine mutase [Moraxella catarrhalis]|uniref:phosphoglucosamine mutase n=1 Tax=Moraxella catarrhalis TaxID=480 RepID=UPI0002029A82|nr:phosphoglucosamine mutase [Moraxella catarrhalis]ARE66124.1 phosphoglucosamine mutase [Moraxella catarrhalis]AXT93119.1 phosphoglucosamine mutase [Moraxella catarrhalis]AXT96745.1 phosphoglucosamine mutase [Moraxella catarrhalis]EGE15397.1 phosphoglucosamine mutase [Moraxella catarrhalis 103P14B1]EGE18058.1 phosphoglucosamine mutase [Moraxella catarrhalis BC1]